MASRADKAIEAAARALAAFDREEFDRLPDVRKAVYVARASIVLARSDAVFASESSDS